MNLTKRQFVLPIAMLVTASVLTGCGSKNKISASSTKKTSDSPAASSLSASAETQKRNAADTAFAQQMIAHHRGAIEMATLAGRRAKNADVKTLASNIAAAQQPEIDTMRGWLKAWGEPVPAADQMPGMDHSSKSSAMPGMMNDKEMKDLKAARGAAFDKMFLELMTRHHQGAITMSREEKSKGANAEAKALATKIIADQTAEITKMRKLLKAV